MTKIALTLCILGAYNGLFAMDQEVTLPSKEELRERLGNIDLVIFVKKTEIDNRLGGQKMYPFGVVVSVSYAINYFNKNFDNQFVTKRLQSNKPRIIKLILQDHPQAIEILEKNNLLE